MKFGILQYIIVWVLLLSVLPCMAHGGDGSFGTADYKIELLGSVATGNQTPFWVVSNKYGTIPLNSNNGYLRASTFYNRTSNNGFRMAAGIDVVACAPRYRNVFVQQVFAEIGYKSIMLTIGSKESYTSLWDKNLSSGDMVASSNARPIPEINILIPNFTIIPATRGWLQFKGNFAVGRSFDTDYLKRFVNENQVFVRNTQWHNKSLHVRILDKRNDFPLTATVGIRHYAQWAGTSSDERIGTQPHSFLDLIRIITGHSGGSDASLSDQINVLGNHYGTYDIKIGYIGQKFSIHTYKQHYFEDTSGMELFNTADGLFGLQATLNNCPWLNRIVVEYIATRDQSGPFHFITFDHSKYPGYGGGNDDYYNNGEYTTGTSYFNRSLGSPLITSPEYNGDGSLGFKNNRIQAWHIGLGGYLSQYMAYRMLVTKSENWGTNSRPFLKKKDQFSAGVRLAYCHPKLNGWQFACEIAVDKGTLLTDNIGLCLSVSKTGIIKIGK